MNKKIIIIGSGFGGLSLACRLAVHGHDVEIFEKRDKPGGRGYVYEINGFKFDGGPTAITAPLMFDDIFKAAGKNREDYVQFVPLEPSFRFFNHAQKVFNQGGDLDSTLGEIERWNPADKKGYRKWLAAAQSEFEKGALDLAAAPFLHFGDMLKLAPGLLARQSCRSVYASVSRFIKNDFLRQVFSFQPLLVGGNPFDTPSFAMLHDSARRGGVFYALGGTGTLIQALAGLFEESGGKINFNTGVIEILTEGRKVNGVRLADGSIRRADIVVSNADVAFTYRNMIPEKCRRKFKNGKIDGYRYSNSLFIVYFGTKRRYLDCGLAHHNIILGQRFKPLLDDIFNRKKLADDFLLYLHMPTLTDPSIAPPGTESFCVAAPVPHLGSGVDWNKMARPYRDRIMSFLEENYLPDLRANIIAEHYIDPLHFQNILNSHLGAAFSIQPLLTQSAWFRPHNQSEDFDNLYFVGAGTHPGAGLPGVLSSAVIVENLIQSAV